ncbi:hypothetical protein NON00_18740 [Roseomonas sp. GC11]|uniref:hypothetical protein n=1 Tax=Roseomonas sp. GC11 TaxID=2950546 RepID=UPI00210A5C03|nr:hypothetical protein [Roseomonas sp. GC11]MCQ4161956.1 hypothetical protein [Roseomonas sp. GC11]
MHTSFTRLGLRMALRALGLAGMAAALPALAQAADANKTAIEGSPLAQAMAVSRMHQGDSVIPGPVGRNAAPEESPLAVPMPVSRNHDASDPDDATSLATRLRATAPQG